MQKMLRKGARLTGRSVLEAHVDERHARGELSSSERSMLLVAMELRTVVLLLDSYDDVPLQFQLVMIKLILDDFAGQYRLAVAMHVDALSRMPHAELLLSDALRAAEPDAEMLQADFVERDQALALFVAAGFVVKHIKLFTPEQGKAGRDNFTRMLRPESEWYDEWPVYQHLQGFAEIRTTHDEFFLAEEPGSAAEQARGPLKPVIDIEGKVDVDMRVQGFHPTQREMMGLYPSEDHFKRFDDSFDPAMRQRTIDGATFVGEGFIGDETGHTLKSRYLTNMSHILTDGLLDELDHRLRAKGGEVSESAAKEMVNKLLADARRGGEAPLDPSAPTLPYALTSQEATASFDELAALDATKLAPGPAKNLINMLLLAIKKRKELHKLDATQL